MRYLIIGYGNTLCGDDGLGPIVADQLAGKLPPAQKEKVDIITVHQLDMVLAQRLKDYTGVIFIDAQTDLYQSDVYIEEITFSGQNINPGSFTAHYMSPRGLLNMLAELYQTQPKAFIVAIHGYSMEFGEGLSKTAEVNAQKAVKAVLALLNQAFPLG